MKLEWDLVGRKRNQENEEWNQDFFKRSLWTMNPTLNKSKTLFKGKGNALIRHKNATCDNGKERDLNTHSNIN